MGADVLTIYAVSVTIADVVMRDGGRLDDVGMTPDELAGGTMTAEDAGKLFRADLRK